MSSEKPKQQQYYNFAIFFVKLINNKPLNILYYSLLLGIEQIGRQFFCCQLLVFLECGTHAHLLPFKSIIDVMKLQASVRSRILVPQFLHLAGNVLDVNCAEHHDK